jgi:phage host-nuclease inhibitor protein Gam
MNPPVLAPAIRTRDQLEALLENIAELHRERDDLWRAQEEDIAAVRQRHRAQLTEIARCLDVETAWAEAWAREHRSELGDALALESPHATLGFRADPPRIERASRRWTWSRIAVTLAALPWGRRYLRIPEPVVDQEALVADLGKLSREELRAAGMDVVEGETFYLQPKSISGQADSPRSLILFSNSPNRQAAA